MYDALGREVRSHEGGNLEAGKHEKTWDGTNESRMPIGSGIYFVRMNVDGRQHTRRMVLFR